MHVEEEDRANQNLFSSENGQSQLVDDKLGESSQARMSQKAKQRRFKKESMIYGIPVKNN